MGLGRIVVVAMSLAGCRFGFTDLDAGDGASRGDGDTADVMTDGDGAVFTCARAVPTTPMIWCDTNAGLDTNPGTQTQPTKTINKALTLAAASGGTIIVGPGNYLETLDISTTKPLLVFSEQRYAARIARLNCAGCTDLTVEGFEISNNSLPLVSITAGTRVALRDNVVYDGSSAGIRVTSGSTNIDIASNVVYDTFASQIPINDVSNVTVRDNVVFYDSGSTSGLGKIWLEMATDAHVTGNVVFRGTGSDPSYGLISLRDTSGATIVENNVLGASPGATSVYSGIGFDMATGTAVIRHNTFVGPMPGAAFGIGAGALMTGSSFTLVNNLWTSTGTTQPFTDGNAGTKVTLRHNLYWNAPTGTFPTGGSPTPASDSEAYVVDPGITSSIPAAPIRGGNGFIGGATTTCEVRTQLVEALAHVDGTSMAVGKADPTQSPSVDVLGHPRPAVPAIGAYQP